MNPDHAMLLITALDPSASVKFSQYTNKWYVEARVEIGDGALLSGCTEHRGTVADAVNAFVAALQGIDLDHYIVARPFGNRRHYRWNGACFAEEPTPTALQVST